MKKQVKAVPAGAKPGVYWCLHIRFYGGESRKDNKTKLTICPIKGSKPEVGSTGGGHDNGYDIADMKYYFDTYAEAAWLAKELHPDVKPERLDSMPSEEKDKEKRRC